MRLQIHDIIEELAKTEEKCGFDATYLPSCQIIDDEITGYRWPFVYLHGNIEKDRRKNGVEVTDISNFSISMPKYDGVYGCRYNNKLVIMVLKCRDGIIAGRGAYADDDKAVKHCLSYNWS